MFNKPSQLKLSRHILIWLGLFFFNNCFSHGFGQNVLVTTSPKRSTSIKILCDDYLDETQKVYGFNQSKNKYVKCKVIAAAIGKTNCYYIIYFNNETHDDIICTPEQEFYLPDKQGWTPAHALRIGDGLLGQNHAKKLISNIRFVEQPITVYSIRVKKCHTFFVGRHVVLTHNFPLPLVSVGVGAAFGSGATAAGTAGAFLGPITFGVGILFGGLFGIIGKTILLKNKLPQYELSYSPVNFGINSREDSELEIKTENKQEKVPSGACSGGDGKPPWDPRDKWQKRQEIRKQIETNYAKDEKFRKAMDHATNSNKLKHIFENNKHDHNLNELLHQIGGRSNDDARKKLIEMVIIELTKSNKLPQECMFNEIPIEVMGRTIHAKVFIDGFIKLNTMFIKKL